MSKRIVSFVITVIMLLGMTALFPSAAAPSLKLVDWKRNDIFTYEFTGAGADSWVGIYYASETPGSDTPALLWKTTGGKTDGTDTMTNGAIKEYLEKSTGGTRYNENFVTLNPGDYKICLFKDGGYEVVAEQKFTVKKYNVMKDKKSVYVSDLKWTSWIVYKQTSNDVQSETNPDGLPLDKITNKPYFDRQVGGFDEATKQFDYGDGASATTNLIVNVAGINYEKGVSLALAKDIRHFDKADKDEKYCEVSFDISGLDVNTFSCVFGKNTPGQVGWSIGGCEIIADEKVLLRLLRRDYEEGIHRRQVRNSRRRKDTYPQSLFVESAAPVRRCQLCRCKALQNRKCFHIRHGHRGFRHCSRRCRFRGSSCSLQEALN